MATAHLHAAVRYLHEFAAAPNEEAAPDGELLGHFATRGDQAAFASLVRRHGPLVLGACRRVLGNVHDAEDCFQATFLVLATKAGALGRPRALGPWLYGVACRVARKARVGAARRAARERQAAARERVPPDDPTWRDLRPALDEAIARLPSKYRDPVVMCYLEGRTVAEAAVRLGWPRGTVATRLARARDRLRAGLSRRGVTLSAGAVVAATRGVASARVPAALVGSTVRTATLVAAGEAAGAGAVPAQVAALAGGANRAMTMTKVKAVAACLLAVALVGGVAGWLPSATRGEPQAGRASAEAASRAGGGGGQGAEGEGRLSDDATGQRVRDAGVSVTERKFRQFEVNVTLVRADDAGRDFGAHGKGKVLGEPRLFVSEGREATFLTGGEVPVPGDEPGTMESLPFGFTVRVKVKRLADGRLRLDAALERSEVEPAGAKGWRRRRVVEETAHRVKLGEEVKLVQRDGAGGPLHWALVRVVREESVQSRTESREAEAPKKGVSKSAYVIEPPDILRVHAGKALAVAPQTFTGEHLVRPDGTVGLGSYGAVRVAGMTTDQAAAAVAAHLRAAGVGKGLDAEQVRREVTVEVLASNSRAVYVLTELAGEGQRVYRLPATGKETVLDAVAQVKGLPPAALRCRVWVERVAGNAGAQPQVLAVDWRGIVQEGRTRTNYPLHAGDRIYVKAVRE